ncbi:hypothetical protein KKF47_01460 [Patescibacteria group bacterium]|nr:hypothetical protein [Patescibacteria group bacterium]MBU4466717.1 hypothetical protein [Patescibacteria group bacterium]
MQYIVLLGAVAQLFGIAFYIKDMIKGKVKPNRITWLMWTIAPLIGAAAAFSSGVTWAVIPVFMAGFGPLLVLVASFLNKKAYWQLKSSDYLCGFFSFLALLLWLITKEPVVAIVFAIISDGLAAVPTLIKSWHHPETESAILYFIYLLGTSTGFLAIKSWVFPEYGFLVYLIAVQCLIIFAIIRPRPVLK